MSTKIFLSILAFVLTVSSFGQKSTLELTFTAVNNTSYFQLDSIKIMNHTQGGDTTLYWPDTVLVLDYHVRVPELNPNQERVQLFQNYPNPVINQTTISMSVPEKDEVDIIITDMMGRVVLKSDRLFDQGIHSFRFAPGGENLYFFTVQWRGNSSSIKILKAASNSNKVSSLKYLGAKASSPQLKATEDIHRFSLSLGDELCYIGYGNALQSGKIDTLGTSETCTFQFATNIPCLGTPTVNYAGQVYNTIQIFSQCWLKENLNVGTMIPGGRDISDDGIIEKYCYNDDQEWCDFYGGLYQWNEMMQYTTQQGTQGICPPNWHLPTDEEWKVLEGAVDSQYGIGDTTWDDYGYRGIDAGINLKTTSGWNSGGNGNDLFGFSSLPSGYRHFYGFFDLIGDYGNVWTSSEGDNYYAWYHYLGFNFPGVIRNTNFKEFGFSVRCLRD